MPTSQDTVDAKRIERVFTELGRCVLLYQAIERLLKFLLPHMNLPGTDTPPKDEGFVNWRAMLDSRLTLGMLFGKLVERAVSSDLEMVRTQLAEIAKHRNEIVHHFNEQPFFRLESQSECDDALRFLHERHAAAAPLLESLKSLAEDFLAELRSSRLPANRAP